MAHYTGSAEEYQGPGYFCGAFGYEEGFWRRWRRRGTDEYFYRFWIAKALCGESFIDILYNSGMALSGDEDV